MVKSFAGGIHPSYNKLLTDAKPVEDAIMPKQIIIPMNQHIGAPCEPIVKRGDMVKKGQKVGEPKGFVSAPVHASTSGKVVVVEPRPYPGGGRVMSVVIEPDGKDELYEEIKPPKSYEDLSPDEIKDLIREAGIVGMGGAMFPTQVKLSPPEDKPIDIVIINGAECEPYITADHRLMLENPEDIILGIEIIMKVVGAKDCIIGIEDNKLDAQEIIKKAIGKRTNIQVVSLTTKYPQGGEKQLIKATTDREVPSGGLPMDIGVIVSNTGTCSAIANLMKTGMPLVERITTITGSGVREPKNLFVKIGTPLAELIKQCGGFADTPGKVLMGGPMMGLAQSTIEVPAIKGTTGILVLKKSDVKLQKEMACIKCARCVDVCPIHLLPTYLGNFAKKSMWTEAQQYNALDCIECGCCSYQCPSHIPLTQLIRLAKVQIQAEKRK